METCQETATLGEALSAVCFRPMAEEGGHHSLTLWR
jgi:hypothetical protein